MSHEIDEFELPNNVRWIKKIFQYRVLKNYLIISLFLIFFTNPLQALASNAFIASPCDMEWMFSLSILPARKLEQISQETINLAEKGDIRAQVYIGLSVNDNKEIRRHWIKKAAENGSLEAAAYYEYYYANEYFYDNSEEYFTPELQSKWLNRMIEMAESGNPRAARSLMNMALGKDDHCPVRFSAQGCQKSPLIRSEDAQKWADIAAKDDNIDKEKSIMINYYNYDCNRRETSLFTPEFQSEWLNPIIKSAEAGDPRAATWLMDMVRGKDEHCPVGFLWMPEVPFGAR